MEIEGRARLVLVDTVNWAIWLLVFTFPGDFGPDDRHLPIKLELGVIFLTYSTWQSALPLCVTDDQRTVLFRV